jgi:RNA polymerase-binding transcription factor DksA
VADAVDRAQACEALDRQLALDAQQRRSEAAMNLPLGETCIECSEPIEPERLRALRGCTSRCASCARDFEQRMNQGRR